MGFVDTVNAALFDNIRYILRNLVIIGKKIFALEN